MEEEDSFVFDGSSERDSDCDFLGETEMEEEESIEIDFEKVCEELGVMDSVGVGSEMESVGVMQKAALVDPCLRVVLPFPHGLQTADREVEKNPIPQILQSLALEELVKLLAVPAGQGLQLAGEDCRVRLLNVPFGHGTGAVPLEGQKAPAGQGESDVVLGQK